MAALDFAIDVRLDGDSYPAARGKLGERQITVSYVPKIKLANMSPIGDATLDPLEYTTFHRGAGASRTVSVNGMVAYGENVWTVDPGLLLPGPEVTSVTLPGATLAPRPDGIAEADGSIFVAAGRYVFKLANGQAIAPAVTQDLDLSGTNIAQSIRRFGTELVLSQTTAALVGLPVYERPDGGAWINNSLGSLPALPTGAIGTVFWTTGAAGNSLTTERLVMQFGPRSIRYCSGAPRLDTSWTPGLGSPAIDIGGTITRFAASLDHLYIATTSGLRDLDASGLAPNLLPEAEVGPLPSGGLAALIKDGTAFVSAGYDLFKITVAGTQYAISQVVTPMMLLPNETPVSGYGTALLSRGPYLIYAQYDPVLDTTWVMWGREASSGQLIGRMPGESAGVEAVRGPELGPYVWNVAPIVLHGWKVTALHISGLATDGPRLWMFGQTLAGAVSAKWAPLAYSTPYGDLKAGRSRRFAQSCFVVLPSEDGGDDAMRKDIEEVLVISENLSGGNSMRVSASKEGSPVFTQLGSFTSSPRALAPVAVPFITERPAFRIDMNGSPLSPPIARRVSVRWLPNPDLRELRRYIFLLGLDERFGSGNRSARSADDQIGRLVLLVNSQARSAFTDEYNNNLIVRVVKLEGPAEVEADNSGTRALSVAVTISIFGSAPGAPFGYDAGIPWDDNRSWS